jgi:PAS domain S-box-containing protein
MTNAEMDDERRAEPAGAEQARPPHHSSWPHTHAEAQAVELAAIFQHAPAGLALYDPGPDLRCVRHNTRFLDLVGQHWRERGSIAGVPLRDLFDKASYLATRAVFERGLATGEVIEIAEYAAVLAPDPEPRYYRWSLTPLKLASGQVSGLLVSAIEITEQVRARQRIAELARLADAKSAQLQLILDSIADGVWVCDAAGQMVEVNRRALEQLGLGDKETSLRPLNDYADLILPRHPDGSPMQAAEFPLMRALQGESVVVEMLARNARTGQDIWLELSAVPLYDTPGQLSGAVAVGRDITANVELTRQKDEFLSLVAHELNTPITVIKGLAQGMERRTAQRIERSATDQILGADELAKYADQLRSVVQQTRRLDRLVGELLDISRLADTRVPLNRAPIDMAALMAEVVARVQSTAPAHPIVLDLVVLDRHVEGDAERIEHVLTNLLQNAVKYSPAGAAIAVSLRAQGAHARVIVRDQGIGVPAAEQPLLFSRFFRASNAPVQRYGGIGLGLYLSAEIIKRHGGTVMVESQEGQGSTFSFTLPLSD